MRTGMNSLGKESKDCTLTCVQAYCVSQRWPIPSAFKKSSRTMHTSPTMVRSTVLSSRPQAPARTPLRKTTCISWRTAHLHEHGLRLYDPTLWTQKKRPEKVCEHIYLGENKNRNNKAPTLENCGGQNVNHSRHPQICGHPGSQILDWSDWSPEPAASGPWICPSFWTFPRVLKLLWDWRPRHGPQIFGARNWHWPIVYDIWKAKKKKRRPGPPRTYSRTEKKNWTKMRKGPVRFHSNPRDGNRPADQVKDMGGGGAGVERICNRIQAQAAFLPCFHFQGIKGWAKHCVQNQKAKLSEIRTIPEVLGCVPHYFFFFLFFRVAFWVWYDFHRPCAWCVPPSWREHGDSWRSAVGCRHWTCPWRQVVVDA